MMVDYIAQLDAVAASFQEQDPAVALQACWMEYEGAARAVHWDVLGEKARLGSCRTLGRELMSLLYRACPNTSAKADADLIKLKDRDYGGSWCKRGGANAFFMLCRKWDRLEQFLAQHGGNWWTMLRKEAGGIEPILDTAMDLRCYLMLVEAWHCAAEVRAPHCNTCGQKMARTVDDTGWYCPNTHSARTVVAGVDIPSGATHYGAPPLGTAVQLCGDLHGGNCSYQRGHQGKCSDDQAHP